MNNKNKNTYKKQHSKNLAIIFTIIGLGIATTSGTVYATQTIAEDLVVGKTDARHFILVSSSIWPEITFQTPTDNGVMRLGVAHADASFGVLKGDLYIYSGQTSRMDLIVPKAGGVHLVANGGKVGIGTTSPTEKLQVEGIIYSTTGGFKFPDGTTQTTANVDNSITNEIETWSTLSGIPAGFSDNTDDNTQLDKAGIEALGFVTGSHTVDTGIIQLDVNRENPDPLDCNTVEEDGRIQIVRINNAPPNMYVCVDNDWKKVKLT